MTGGRGMNVEHCVKCDEATGRAGRGDDSLFDADGKGPYCENCWDKTGEPMKKEIGGKVQVPETFACDGCAAERGDDLCLDLHDDTMTCGNKIWEEEKMRAQKTALELVDECFVTNEVNMDNLENIKSAIEREHENKMDNIARLQAMYDTQSEHVAEAEQRIKRLEQNAVNMPRCEITMRPISELPDTVPEGCVIVAVGGGESWTWDDEAEIPHEWLKRPNSRKPALFCIITIPEAERKLKACPYCQAIPVKLTNYWDIKHTDACPIQSACVIMFDKCDIWGWK